MQFPDKAEEFEEEAKLYAAEADELDKVVERLEEKVRQLEAEVEIPEMAPAPVEMIEAHAVQDTKAHTVHEANRVMWKIMGNAQSVPGTEEIVIVGQVLGDGRGDWAAMRNMHNVLKKKYPNRPIRIIASSAQKWENKLDVSGIERLDLIYYGNMSSTGAAVPLEAFPKEAEILKKAQDAGVFITAGVNINTVFDSIREDLREKSIRMKEHDMGTLSSNNIEIGDTIIQGGLDVNDDRMGIFTNAYKKEHKWSDLTSPKLISALFNAEKPNGDDIEAYQSTHECFFGYVGFDSSIEVFIRDAVAFAGKHSPNKKVDICLPGMLTYPDISSAEEFEDLKSFGVGKVQLVWFEGSEKKERTLVIDENNDVEIRLIDPGTISNQDFKIMTQISAPIVACTGDNSLAQAISYGKIPYYERRFMQKWGGLLTKIEERLGKDSALYQYCSQSAQDFSKVLADSLVEEAKQFGEYIRNEANLKPVLNGVVNEKLLRQQDPDFAHKQDELRQQYLDNSISQAQLETQFKELLTERGMI